MVIEIRLVCLKDYEVLKKLHFSTARTLQRVEHSPDLLKRHLLEAAELLNMPFNPSITEVGSN